jgi:hypothetical protein
VTENPHRCDFRCQVVPSVWKRCIRDVDHAEAHVWIEALNRADGLPRLMTWSVPLAEQPDVIAELHLRGRGSRASPRRGGGHRRPLDEPGFGVGRLLHNDGEV